MKNILLEGSNGGWELGDDGWENVILVGQSTVMICVVVVISVVVRIQIVVSKTMVPTLVVLLVDCFMEVTCCSSC